MVHIFIIFMLRFPFIYLVTFSIIWTSKSFDKDSSWLVTENSYLWLWFNLYIAFDNILSKRWINISKNKFFRDKLLLSKIKVRIINFIVFLKNSPRFYLDKRLSWKNSVLILIILFTSSHSTHNSRKSLVDTATHRTGL